jgi:hypothetical protein
MTFPLPGRPGHGRTAFVRRQPVRIVDGRAEGGYTGVFEFICPSCGDNPYVDYSEIPPRLQRLRGPHVLQAALEAYDEHLGPLPGPNGDSAGSLGPGYAEVRQVGGRFPWHARTVQVQGLLPVTSTVNAITIASDNSQPKINAAPFCTPPLDARIRMNAERERFERDRQAEENEVEGDHMRPDLLATLPSRMPSARSCLRY